MMASGQRRMLGACPGDGRRHPRRARSRGTTADKEPPMHVTAATIWESEMHRQDLLAMARWQKTARARERERATPTVKRAARYARAVIASLATIAIGLSTT